MALARYRLAALVDQLFERYHVAVLGFDVVFAEPDSTDSIFKALIHGPLGQDPGQRTELVRLRRELDPDRRFAVAMHGHPVVLGYFSIPERRPMPAFNSDFYRSRSPRFGISV